MYKRHALGEAESKTISPAGAFTFFAFCSVVLWAVPAGIEAVSGTTVEMYMMPPTWRAEILCAPAEGHPNNWSSTNQGVRYTYVHDGDNAGSECTRICVDAGCAGGGDPAAENGDDAIRTNLNKAREGLDLYDVFEVVFLILKWGAVVTAIGSLVVMRTGGPDMRWACLPCGAMVAAAALNPQAFIAVIPVYAAAYASDMWSTARFGPDRLRLFETNPILRRLIRHGPARAFSYHTMINVALVSALAAALAVWGPVSWEHSLGMLLAGLAGAHFWFAACNMREYKAMEAER